jgi:predicted ribosome quality control (RQC) complex YloA/Tae2 family protein
MDYKLIKIIINELLEYLPSAKVSKIHQPAPEVIIFKLWNGRENLRLLVSVEVNRSRLHLTENTWPNPYIPPRFCQLLRARIDRIHSMTVVNDDRIVQLECSGQQGHCRLMAELTGKNSNLILLNDQGVIIDVLKRVSGAGKGRNILPGEEYLLPEKKQSDREIEKKLAVKPGANCSWNQYVEKLYNNAELVKNKQELSLQLQEAIGRQIKKLNKRIINIEKEYSAQQNFDEFKQRGELLLANLQNIKRGMEAITLLNYYLQTPEPIEIVLDPVLRPQQNVEKYFKRYKKAKRGLEHSQRRLQETRTELEWLEQLDYQLKDAVNNSDIEEIAQELKKAGLLREVNRLHARRTLPPSKPHEAVSPSGFKIFWGRNNRQNDEISTKILKEGDLWFHVHNISGAHVVMKVGNKKKTVTDEDFSYAAALAAGYSTAKNDNKVEVLLAAAKFVHKPKGGRPGLVNVLRYETLVVKPLRLD